VTSSAARLAEFGLEFSAMASRCEVRVCAPDAANARAWTDLAIDEVRRIEAKYSRYRPDSVTARINGAAGGADIDVDPETAALLDFAARLYDESAGRFDLTSGVLRRAWDFTAQRVPDQRELDTLLVLVGWPLVEWRAPRLRLPYAGMELDFGGIGKEYAADRAADVLRRAGARHGFVNLGGDVRGIGPAPDGTPWRIGIQHPRARGELLGSIDLVAAGIATSGDYERYFEHDGRRYCHILDPRTGWPAHHWQCVSVTAPACVAAGACATVAMLLPHDDALAFLHRQGVEFLAVTASGEVIRR
jgi:thiamine biosynthesis lipoprotein